MITVQRHGVKYSDLTTCPFCKCVIEYTNDEVRTDGYIDCPECNEAFMVKACHGDLPKYVRDRAKEAEAIDKCLDGIDFEELATACHVLSTNMPDAFDYLDEHTVDSLKEKAKKELEYCFDCMEKYGYLINYKGGGTVLSYTVDGAFSVNTYYDPNEDSLWCNCIYSIAYGGLY